MRYMTAAQRAVERFEQGYSCSQAVFSALAEERGVDLELALRIAAGLGGGLARSGETCGCITGAVMAIGLTQPSVAPADNRAQKEETYQAARRFMSGFVERQGSTRCRDLLGCDIGTPEGLAKARDQHLFQSRCAALVRDAVDTAETILNEPRP